jgi:cell division septation protein DedD
MDDQLKARLIGAVILVALAVLLIPELLSGRKPESTAAESGRDGRGTRTYTIDLTGAAPAQPTPTPTPTPTPRPEERPRPPEMAATPPPAEAPVVAEASTSQATATQAPPAQTAPVRPVATAPASSAPPKAATSAPAPAVEHTTTKPVVKGGWVVQVGAFGSPSTAGKLASDLKSAGYPAFVSPISRGGKTLHRVRVGPVPGRADADALAVRLKARKLPVTVVAND